MTSHILTVATKESLDVKTQDTQEHEPSCALGVTIDGISGDDIARHPEDYETFQLRADKITAQCAACALRVCIDTKDDSGTAINKQPCLYK